MQRIPFRFAAAAAAALASLGAVVLIAGPAAAQPQRGLSAAPSSQGVPAVSYQTLTITATDYAFAAPDRVSAGLTEVTLINHGTDDYDPLFSRLNDGTTMDVLQAAIARSPDAALSLLSFFSSPGQAHPGQQSHAVLNLQPGHYLLIDTAHLDQGMLQPITVTASTGAQPAEPSVDATVTEKEFTFEVPGGIKAGQQTWKIQNSGEQIHEMDIIKLANGQTIDDVKAFNPDDGGTPPGDDAGYVQLLSGGNEVFANLSFSSGTYVLICHMPDTATGQEHAALGMVTSFTVQ